MVSIKQIFEWFKRGANPDEQQFQQTWSSFWHKSEKMPLTQVLGLNNSLAEKVDKSDIENIVGGMIKKGSVDNISDLPATAERGDSYYVINEKNPEGLSYIYQYDGSKWNNTKQTAFPDDVALRGEYEGLTFRFIDKATHYPVGTWPGAAIIEKDIETQLFGKTQKATEIKPLRANGNIFSINIDAGQDRLDYKTGDKITLSFELYSPSGIVNCSAFSYGSSAEGVTQHTALDKKFTIKSGVQTYVFILTMDKVYSNYMQVVFTIPNQIGTEFYLINQTAYVGTPVIAPLIDNSIDKVDKIEGKSLSTNDFTTSEKDKLATLEYIPTDKLFTNITDNSISKYISVNCTKELYSDNSVRFYRILKPENTFNGYIYLNHIFPSAYNKKHDYYIAFDIKVDAADFFTGSDFNPELAPKYNDSNKVGTGLIKKTITIGERGILKGFLSIQETGNIESYPTANRIFMQFGGKYSAGMRVDLSVYNILMVDLGERTSENYISYEQMDSYFEQYGFVDSVNTISFSENAKIAETAKKVEGLDILKLYQNNEINEIGNYFIGGNSCQKSINSDTSIKFLRQGIAGTAWTYFNYITSFNWKSNHSYYVAFDVLVNKADIFITGGSNAGNVIPSIVPKYNDSTTLGTGEIKKTVLVGERGILKAQIKTNTSAENYPSANRLFFQFGKFSDGQDLDADFYNILIVDLGETGKENISFDVMDSYLADYGFAESPSFVSNALNANTAGYALVAKSVEILTIGGAIQFWGDSLTAQDFAKYIREKTGRNCISRGFGGKKSTYIRDQFLAGVDKSMTQVIWVGRNNYGETDIIIDDIRAMIDFLGHDKFIICNPPNGGYGTLASSAQGATGEMKGGASYEYFLKITDLLQYEYGSHFLDLRRAMINGYTMGNIKLLSSFIQPAIGSTVQINVSDANFLTTYNANDISKFGNGVMNHIRIGFMDKCDRYEVVSKDSDTLLTVKLIEINRINTSGTVANLIDDGGTNAIKYLRVMQNADYECFLNDTLASTFRSDGIHMTEAGKKITAITVARKIEAMKI